MTGHIYIVAAHVIEREGDCERHCTKHGRFGVLAGILSCYLALYCIHLRKHLTGTPKYRKTVVADLSGYRKCMEYRNCFGKPYGFCE